jgi:hypothetical protein
LRQFVEFCFAQQAADSRDSPIVIAREAYPASIGVDNHGPKLPNPERFAEAAYSGLTKKDGPSIGYLDEQSDDKGQGQHEQKTQPGGNEVE